MKRLLFIAMPPSSRSRCRRPRRPRSSSSAARSRAPPVSCPDELPGHRPRHRLPGARRRHHAHPFVIPRAGQIIAFTSGSASPTPTQSASSRTSTAARPRCASRSCARARSAGPATTTAARPEPGLPARAPTSGPRPPSSLDKPLRVSGRNIVAHHRAHLGAGARRSGCSADHWWRSSRVGGALRQRQAERPADPGVKLREGLRLHLLHGAPLLHRHLRAGQP